MLLQQCPSVRNGLRKQSDLWHNFQIERRGVQLPGWRPLLTLPTLAFCEVFTLGCSGGSADILVLWAVCWPNSAILNLVFGFQEIGFGCSCLRGGWALTPCLGAKHGLETPYKIKSIGFQNHFTNLTPEITHMDHSVLLLLIPSIQAIQSYLWTRNLRSSCTFIWFLLKRK